MEVRGNRKLPASVFTFSGGIRSIPSSRRCHRCSSRSIPTNGMVGMLSVDVRAHRPTEQALKPLFQLFVLLFGVFEDWDVGIGILPYGEEILISRLCLCRVALQCIGAAKSQFCQGSKRAGRTEAAMVDDLLVFRRGLGAIAQTKIGLGTNGDRLIRA